MTVRVRRMAGRAGRAGRACLAVRGRAGRAGVSAIATVSTVTVGLLGAIGTLPAAQASAAGRHPGGTQSAATAATAAKTKDPVAQAGRTYLAIVAPANKAIVTFADQSKSWTPQTPSSQAAAEARPVVAALDLVRLQLAADQWPARARVGITILRSDLGPMIHDLEALRRTDMHDPSQWLTTYEADESTVQAQSRIVRHALRLPQIV